MNMLLQGLHKLISKPPCVLCQLSPAHQHSVCQNCWNSLPWNQEMIHRQELDIIAACEYRYPMDRIIQQFKYEQQLQFQTLLAGSLICKKLPRVQAIVPMPISQERLIERGFNQSVVIAQQLARQLNVPVWQPIIRQHQHAQKGLSRVERLECIHQQFIIDSRIKTRYRKVLIIDDVVTTGSSVKALTEQLESMGCQQVHIACLAAAKI